MRSIRLVIANLLFLAALSLTGLLSGCSSNAPTTASGPESQRMDFSNPNWVKEILYSQYGEWRSVKYKEGGLSKGGVDCSGFVYLTFDARFAIKLPRATDEQINAGPEIPQEKLIPGDLVFFKTGRSMRHVGIYLENRKFMHASTEKGVMISSLDDQYWARTYWKSVRVRASRPQLSAL